MVQLNKQNFTLTYLERFDIEHKEAGLTEPSGLTLSHGKNAFWAISDDTKNPRTSDMRKLKTAKK